VVYVFGGWDHNYALINSTEAYFPSKNSWNKLNPMRTPRIALTSGVVNNVIYAIGGAIEKTNLNTNEAFKIK